MIERNRLNGSKNKKPRIAVGLFYVSSELFFQFFELGCDFGIGAFKRLGV